MVVSTPQQKTASSQWYHSLALLSLPSVVSDSKAQVLASTIAQAITTLKRLHAGDRGQRSNGHPPKGMPDVPWYSLPKLPKIGCVRDGRL
ncbi:hypothetical protein EJ03DRAFT_135684 [Teratosphaeria nubilosa]|uniref:Uncharacterized protein n=1 Tax=Teratosphaeria nubilosa TaxID=161662 RepID=A0A6G1L5D9_9PEZI|nr:hypothetical protein EJ03DRAFT_135684 [Teratosphaeria nubilosa]